MHFDAKTSEYFLELLRSVLHDRTASPKPEDVSWNDLFEYAKSQSLSTMAYRAIQTSGFDIGAELSKEWATLFSRNLVAYVNQEHECERLCKAFSDAGIMNMPLKGSVIRKLFPAPEMREMCDLDILVKPEDIERAHEIMLEKGYDFIEEHTTSHNRDYQKPPYLNVEIHNYLLPRENRLFFYYADYWTKAVYKENDLTCRMGWDDCYVYMIAHTYKHFSQFGTGIRSVLDAYLMRSQLKDILDREYITAQLKILGILDFANSFERLSVAWFEGENNDMPEELQFYNNRVLESGTYGENDILKAKAMKYISEGKSLRYAKRRMAITKVFPSYANMKRKYPCLKYLPFLLPLFWVLRWISTVFAKPKKMITFFKKLKHLSLNGYKEERR